MTAHKSLDGGAPLAAANGDFGRLAEVALPLDSRSPGAARLVVAHCLTGLVSPRILHNAQLLVSELVTNSLRHGDLGDEDTVLLRVYIAADTVRLEIENPRTAGVIAARSPDRHSGGGFGLNLVEVLAARWGVNRGPSTNVWLETSRA